MDLKTFSIPGPPVVGSEVPVVIKKISLKSRCGLVELLVDIGCEGKAVNENSSEENTNQMSHNGEDISHLITGSTLLRRQNKSSPPPYKLETCFLANILPYENTWSEKATIFLKSVLEKKISGLVEEVLMPDRVILLDIPLVSNHLCRRKLAKKIYANEFKSLVLSSPQSPEGQPPMACSVKPKPNDASCTQEPFGQYLYLELQHGHFMNVEVTEVTDKLNLFCKFSIFSKELKKLSEQMQLYYDAGLVLGQPQACGSPCAARGTDGMWCRSRLMQDLVSGADSVEVLHVDNGRTQLVPVGYVKHIHEQFLRKPVVTYHCALDGMSGKGEDWTVDQIDYLKSRLRHAVVARFERYDAVKNVYDATFFDADGECINACFTEKAGALSDANTHEDSNSEYKTTPLKSCKARRYDAGKTFSSEADLTKKLIKNATQLQKDPQGLAYSVVDLKTPLHSACNLLATTISQADARLEVFPAQPVVSSYNYSTQNIDIGSKEEVCITCCVGVDHFYCRLLRSTPLFDKMMGDVGQQLGSRQQCTDCSLVVDAACLARYTDNEWYRGQIKTVHPNLQVCFVDFGDVISLKRTDVCVFPAECSTIRSLPVQAIAVGLFNVPPDVPKEVNVWFEEQAIDQYFTMSVETKDTSGKLIVELFNGTLNVNLIVRERIAMVKNKTGLYLQSVPQPSPSMRPTTIKVIEVQKQMNEPTNGKTFQQNEVGCSSRSQGDVEQKTSGPSTAHTFPDAGKHLNPSLELGQTTQNATLADLPPPRFLEPGSSSVVHVSHFNNPACFFVQLHQDENEIYNVAEKLNDSETSFAGPVKFNSLHIGDLISAEFPVDGCWYRVVVRNKLDNETLHVEFIDFGNEATIPCVKTCYLDKEFIAQPRFSIPCTSISLEQWNEEATVAFKRSMVVNPEKTFACTFIKETLNVWEVSLEDDGIALAPTFLQQTNSDATHFDGTKDTVNHRYSKPDVILNGAHRVYASCIVGPHFFWCQHANTEVLDKMSKLIEEAGRTGKQDNKWVETLRLGSPCLALFTDDQRWYRAQVVRRTSGTLSVLFIDYGNEAEVDAINVKTTPRFLLEMAPQAFLCSLDGFEESKGTWGDSAFDDFYELLVDKALSVTPLTMGDNLETAIPQYTVKVEHGEMVVNRAMENYWKDSEEKDANSSLSSDVFCSEDQEVDTNVPLLNAFTEWYDKT